jgi:hypothetical protein
MCLYSVEDLFVAGLIINEGVMKPAALLDRGMLTYHVVFLFFC